MFVEFLFFIIIKSFSWYHYTRFWILCAGIPADKEPFPDKMLLSINNQNLFASIAEEETGSNMAG